MIKTIESIMRQAGEMSLRDFGKLAEGQVDYKSVADLVTPVDRKVEQFLREQFAAAFPEAGFVGEEGGGAPARQGRYFVVDPVDGTTNYVHGLPYYCISVALKEAGKTILGAVYAPCFDDFYFAEAGKGAFKNGLPVKVSQADELIRSLAAAGFACVRQRIKPDSLGIFNLAVSRTRAIRCLGSAAMELCLIAEGRLDLYWEINIQPWDIAAGALIVEEAGGRVSDLSGGCEQEQRRQILASNGRVHALFLDLVREAEMG